MMAAYEGKTVKQWLMDLARVRLAEMETKGSSFILPSHPVRFFFTLSPYILRPFPSFLSVPLKFSDSLDPLVERVYS